MKTTTKTHEAVRIHSRCLRSQQGITLIETMVALGLFALVAAAMSDFLVHQIRQSSSNYLDTLAYSLAADTLELARAARLASVAQGSTTIDEGGVTFTTTTQVENDTPSQGMKTITAVVTWNEPSGPKSVSVPTIYTEVSPILVDEASPS